MSTYRDSRNKIICPWERHFVCFHGQFVFLNGFNLFEELYRRMNGMPLREMDKIIDTVCALCRDHEKAGFVEGIKTGVRLESEMAEE